MTYKKTALIIPGFYESASTEGYKEIRKYFEDRKFNTYILDIPWKKNTMSDYVNYFIKEYSRVQEKEIYVLGFSFGAMISFISSTKVKFDYQILCSLSPYFKEDLSIIRKWWLKSIGKNRADDFYQFSYKELAPLITTQTYMLVGANETKEILHTNEEVFKFLRCEKKLEFVKDARHKISDQNYLECIKRIVKTN